MAQDVPVELRAPSDPLVSRTFDILKDRIELRCPARVVRATAGGQVVLTLEEGLPPDAFRISQDGAAVCVAGESPRGLLYGVGKLLRTSRYDGAFRPSDWRGMSAPQGSMRGIYFATHFHNYYQQAPVSEIVRYTEDLALWGVNAIWAIYPMIDLDGWDDPQAEPAMAMLRAYARAARDLGLQFGTGLNNALDRGAPPQIRATPLPDPTGRRGNSGHPLCPSIPEGHAYLMDGTRRLFERLADIGLDLLVLWPYDEGGCACERCAPWGSNGFLRLSHDQADLARELFPDLKVVLSTWMFDTPPEGEWQGLADALDREPGWVDYILADSHEDFPRYPLDVGVPGNLPLINFPEISMWGNWPWGGVGANPLPSRFQALWDQVKHTVSGGYPYSEGIYEDLNKAVVTQFYWDRDRSARSTIAEYIAYEFSPDVVEETLEIIDLFEATAGASYRKQPVDVAQVQRAAQLAEWVHERLPEWAQQSWRWEILRLRALLDRERFVRGSLETPEAEAAMTRLIEIYHGQMETDDPYHHRVRPPLRGVVSRKGNL